MLQNKIILLCGPTASGKTDLSLKLADFFPIEIISIDSALIYNDLIIGTAKPTACELAKVPHHLIDILSPLQNYSVMQFLIDCELAIEKIHSRKKIPVLVGGTMMYYNAFLKGISELPAANFELRNELMQEFNQLGNLAMYNKLAQLDALSASKISPNDIQRLQRALEVCLLTGKPMSSVQQECRTTPLVNKYNTLSLALMPESREEIHYRVNARFDKMIEFGLIDEVERLQKKYPLLTSEHNSMRCVGYRQVWSYLHDEIDYNQMLESGKAATRQLAKHQITWLRSLDEFTKINSSNLSEHELLENVLKLVKQFLV